MERLAVRIVLSILLLAASLFPAAAAPARWNVDQAKSSLSFVVDVNGQRVTGKFVAFGALIAFDPADLANSSAKITIDMTAAKSGDATRDAMLLKPDWFNVLDYPQAVYQTTGFVSKGGNAYEARGKLTLKGVAREVALPFTLTINGNTAIAKGEATLMRRAFNVGASKEFETGKPVALNVKVLVSVTARRAQ
jgi:polyisoprenoid-binding protein YceI